MAVGIQERVLEQILGQLGTTAELAARVAQQLRTVPIYERTKRVVPADGGERGLPRAGPASARVGSALWSWYRRLLVFVCSVHGP